MSDQKWVRAAGGARICGVPMSSHDGYLKTVDTIE